jgi:hypothetical protein
VAFYLSTSLTGPLLSLANTLGVRRSIAVKAS